MTIYYRKTNTVWQGFAMFLFLTPLLFLAACGGSTPSTQSTGPQLLSQVVQDLKTAKTLHGIFNLIISSQTLNGTIKTEVWNESPSKNRTLVLQSSLSRFSTGTIVVTDGKQEWLYSPSQKVVYTDMLSSPTGAGTPTTASSGYVGQSLSPLALVQQFLTQSDATLISSSATINGHTVYDVHIASKSKDAGAQYTGEVYIDTTTKLLVQVVLNTQSAGNGAKEVVDVPMLTLNSAVPDSIFAFTAPAGIKVMPFPHATTSTTTLAQAQQQASYHLLSIPTGKTYVLQTVNVLGSPGQEIYELDYINGGVTFAIDEGKSLGSLADYPGNPVTVRGNTGTTTTDSGGTTTLFWIEKGIPISITGTLSNTQAMAIAQMLK